MTVIIVRQRGGCHSTCERVSLQCKETTRAVEAAVRERFADPGDEVEAVRLSDGWHVTVNTPRKK